MPQPWVEREDGKTDRMVEDVRRKRICIAYPQLFFIEIINVH